MATSPAIRKLILNDPNLSILKYCFYRADKLAKSKRRFSAYFYLREVYAVYKSWKDREILKRRIDHLIDVACLRSQPGTHAIRTIIDATLLAPDKKSASRWTRALQFAYDRGVRPEALIKFMKKNGGISGCAKGAAAEDRKSSFDKLDW